MSNRAPDRLDPWRAVDLGAEYAGRLRLSEFPRLRDLLAGTDGAVEYWLAFSRDAERRGILHVRIRARLILVCQRCLGPFDHDMELAVALALVSGPDEARGLPGRYDPLLAASGLIRPAELIEDELLLALPQIPTHAPGECSPAQRPAGSGHAQDGGAAPTPFAALANLKRRSSDSAD